MQKLCESAPKFYISLVVFVVSINRDSMKPLKNGISTTGVSLPAERMHIRIPRKPGMSGFLRHRQQATGGVQFINSPANSSVVSFCYYRRDKANKTKACKRYQQPKETEDVEKESRKSYRSYSTKDSGEVEPKTSRNREELAKFNRTYVEKHRKLTEVL